MYARQLLHLNDGPDKNLKTQACLRALNKFIFMQFLKLFEILFTVFYVQTLEEYSQKLVLG
jgi:hypothetical protein